MKGIVNTVLLALALTACASQTHFPMQAQEVSRKLIAENLIKQPEERILAYFDARQNEQLQESAGGFYRVLLGYTAKGDAVVQDFYQDTHSKKTSAAVIRNQNALKMANLGVALADGYLIHYAETGELKSVKEYSDGHLTRAAIYQNNRLLQSSEKDQQNAAHRLKVFYENGNLAYEAIITDNHEHDRFHYENGQLMMESFASAQETAEKYFTIDGQQTDKTAISQQLESIQQYAYAMLDLYHHERIE